MDIKRIYKILVVEDEPKILRNIIKKIENVGECFEIAGKAINGEEALTVYGIVKPDLLITDIRMPKMDGLELIGKVREIDPDIEVIILSGYDEFEYAKRAIKLGVTDYLLKPVEIDALKQTLSEVKSRLETRRNLEEQKVLSFGIHERAENFELPYMFKDTQFYLLLITLGNLCNFAMPDEQYFHYKELWDKVQWEHALSVITDWEKNGRWWLIDEKNPNQKFILFFCDSFKSCNINKLSGDLIQILRKQTHFGNISICPGEKPVSYQKIWELAQKLRRITEQGLLIGESTIITEQSVRSAEKLPPLLNAVTLDQINFLLRDGNWKILKRELNKLFDMWNQRGYPQKALERGLLQLLRYCYIRGAFFTNVQLDSLEKHILLLVAVAPDKDTFFQEVGNLMEKFFQPKKEDKNVDSLADEISQYIQRHYSEEMTLESIAREFSISVSYAIKLFKKYQNKTMMQYVIEIRIREAKRLMTEHPELDVRAIGEMVGYNDQHYFSRAFKNVTGMSPSEFRNS